MRLGVAAVFIFTIRLASHPFMHPRLPGAIAGGLPRWMFCQNPFMHPRFPGAIAGGLLRWMG